MMNADRRKRLKSKKPIIWHDMGFRNIYMNKSGYTS